MDENNIIFIVQILKFHGLMWVLDASQYNKDVILTVEYRNA